MIKFKGCWMVANNGLKTATRNKFTQIIKIGIKVVSDSSQTSPPFIQFSCSSNVRCLFNLDRVQSRAVKHELFIYPWQVPIRRLLCNSMGGKYNQFLSSIQKKRNYLKANLCFIPVFSKKLFYISRTSHGFTIVMVKVWVIGQGDFCDFGFKWSH